MHIAKCETDMTLEGLQFLVHIFVWSTETNVNGPMYKTKVYCLHQARHAVLLSHEKINQN